MAEYPQPPSASTENDTSAPVPENPAVVRCMSAWERVYREESENGQERFHACQKADKAYRNAMPPLAGYENICDFIACTAYAMLKCIILGEQSAKLLYAAQVALSAVRCQPAPRKPHAA